MQKTLAQYSVSKTVMSTSILVILTDINYHSITCERPALLPPACRLWRAVLESNQ